MKHLSSLLMALFTLVSVETAEAVEIFAVCASRDSAQSDVLIRFDSSAPQTFTTLGSTGISAEVHVTLDSTVIQDNLTGGYGGAMDVWAEAGETLIVRRL